MSEEKEIEDLTNADVVTKYKAAGDIANAALARVVSTCKAGAKIFDLCALGDAFIEDAVGKIYNKKTGMKKGIGFPTCLSVNNVVGHFSPMVTDKEEDAVLLKEGDVVKIDLGVQIDGYAAVVAHSFEVGTEGPSTEPATGKKADVLAAAQTAAELAVRMMKIGNKNTAITEMLSKVADDYKVNVVQGVLSHCMNRHVIDGEKVIISKSDVDHKVDEVEFLPNEVYAIDIVMSTGEGKPKEIDERSTVYKRNPQNTYQLKMKASRAVLANIDKQYPSFPFSLTGLEASAVTFGIKELLTHDLVQGYPVLFEKEGAITAHIKFTVLLMPSGTLKITGFPHAPHSSELSLTDEDLKKTMALSAGGPKKKKKKNKPKAKKEAEAAE